MTSLYCGLRCDADESGKEKWWGRVGKEREGSKAGERWVGVDSLPLQSKASTE